MTTSTALTFTGMASLELGESSVGRVKKLLGALHAAETNESGGKKVSAAAAELTNKFISTVQAIFSALPKPIGWQSFYVNSLPLVTKLDAEVRELAIENEASLVKIEAERKAGAMLGSTLRKGGDRKSNRHRDGLKLADLGIDENQSRRWQTAASVPEKEFRAHVETVLKSGENTCRKPFNPEEAVAIGERIEAVAKTEAQQRQKEGQSKGGKSAGKGRSRDSSGKSFTKPERDNSKRATAVAAKAVGMSHVTYEKAKAVVETCPTGTQAEMAPNWRHSENQTNCLETNTNGIRSAGLEMYTTGIQTPDSPRVEMYTNCIQIIPAEMEPNWFQTRAAETTPSGRQTGSAEMSTICLHSHALQHGGAA